MKRTIATLAAIFAASTAMAAEELSTLDTNADGVLSVEEFAAAFPDIDPATFAAVDKNEDGMIDPAEYAEATAEDGPLAG